MFYIKESRNIHKVVPKLPKQVKEKYEFWKNVIRFEGLEGLRKIRGFNDESLKGDWKGYRSSRLNQQYRVIYKIEKELIEIHVVEITAHDYRRK